jgi:hypothetical protein
MMGIDNRVLYPGVSLTRTAFGFSKEFKSCLRDMEKTRNPFFSLYDSIALWTIAILFSFLILYIVGRTHWTGDQPVARPLLTHDNTNTE